MAPESTPTKPPYSSFSSLTQLLDELTGQPLPARIDRSFSHFNSKSGSWKSQMMTTLTALGLIDEDGEPQPRLQAMVEDPKSRPTQMAEALWEYYREPLEQPNTTQRQLDEWLRERGLSGSTLIKATAFLLRAAEYSDVKVSPYWSTGGQARKRSSNRRAKPTKTAKPDSGVDDDNGALDEPDALPLQELQARYVGLLMQRAEAQEDLDTDLLDRIERLLGFVDS